MQICEKTQCCGCMACASVCPVQAISVALDDRGFYIPEINEDICVKCGKCSSTCPNNSAVRKSKENFGVYAVWNKDEALRNRSTSGGVFFGIASYILENGGCVFGAALSEEQKAEHICIESLEDLQKAMGSKYVQSDMGLTYRSVKEKLESGRSVLFTGTPCQTAGLINYLGKTYDNLLTMDIVCHGVPSPKAFSDYLSGIESRYGSRAVAVSFRYKKPSWTVFSMKIDFENGKSYCRSCRKDPYLAAFLSDHLTRECCHSCKYTSIERVSDITAADFWSFVSMSKQQRNNEKGISLVLVNTGKGREVFDLIKKDYTCFERNVNEAKRGNRCLSRPYGPAKDKDAFWDMYSQSGDFFAAVERFCPKKKVSVKHLISEEINRNYYLLPPAVRKRFDRMISAKMSKNEGENVK